MNISYSVSLLLFYEHSFIQMPIGVTLLKKVASLR